MTTKMLLATKLDQRLVMNQQLRQAITLLQYNTLELKQLIKQHIETNPLIEIEESLLDEQEMLPTAHYSTPHYKISTHTNDDNIWENYAVPKSLRDHLLEQTYLCRFSSNEQLAAEAIIDAIDENGYCTMSSQEIQASLPYTVDLTNIENVFEMIHSFDPIGIGAKNVQECLLIQLEHLPHHDENWLIAQRIIQSFFSLLSSNNTKKLLKELNISNEQYAHALSIIRLLNPKPGLQYSDNNHLQNDPELYVKKVKNTWTVFLADSLLTHLKINNQYKMIIKQHKEAAYEKLHVELQEAQWLLKGLHRRNETLLKVATHIMKVQKEFLDHGQSHMRSLTLADVAGALNLHDSTISRVTTGKYIATPRGVFELKYFFTSHLTTNEGDMCSAIAVKELIKDIIASENGEHIFSDGEIAILLKQKGIRIARRTVAKYREALKILPSSQRALLHT